MLTWNHWIFFDNQWINFIISGVVTIKNIRVDYHTVQILFSFLQPFYAQKKLNQSSLKGYHQNLMPYNYHGTNKNYFLYY